MTDEMFIQVTKTLEGVALLIRNLPLATYQVAAKAIISPSAFEHKLVHANLSTEDIRSGLEYSRRLLHALYEDCDRLHK